MPKDRVVHGLSLVEYLADLRSDLEAARRNTPSASAKGVLMLSVDEVTVTLEVAHQAMTSGEIAGKVGGKLWVFASAEASAKGGHEDQRSETQTLTLKLKPRIETTTVDEQGQSATKTRGLDVDDPRRAGEQKTP